MVSLGDVPTSVSVTTVSQVVSKTKLIEKAIQAVKEKLALPQDSYSVTPISNAYYQVVLTGQLSLKAEVPNGIRYNGTTLVKISIYVDNNLYTIYFR